MINQAKQKIFPTQRFRTSTKYSSIALLLSTIIVCVIIIELYQDLFPPSPDIVPAGFYERENIGGESYTFSQPQAHLLLPGLASIPAALTLRISSPLPLPPRMLAIRHENDSMVTVLVSEVPRTIQLFILPSNASTDILVTLETTAAIAPNDVRQLGLKFNNIHVNKYGSKSVVQPYLTFIIFTTLVIATIATLYIYSQKKQWNIANKISINPYITLTIVTCITYTTVLSMYSIKNHNLYYTTTYDLGHFDQVLWLMNQGYYPYSTGIGLHGLGDHVSIILYPLSLIYYLIEDVRFLLFVQSLFIACGIIPLYLVAKSHHKESLGLLAGTMYLVHPATTNANLFDFHLDKIAGTVLLFLLWAIDSKRWKTTVFLSLIFLACKENFAITIAFLGFWLLLYKQWRLSLLLIMISVSWFMFTTRFVLPLFAGQEEALHISRFAQYGNSIPEILYTFVTKPLFVFSNTFTTSTQWYILQLFIPFLFLPLLNPRYLVLAIPALSLNIFSNFEAQRTINFHYNAIIIVIAAFSSLQALLWISRRFPYRYIMAATSICFPLILWYTYTTMPTRLVNIHTANGIDIDRKYYRDYVVYHTPDEANVSAQDKIQPHLTHRKQAFMFPNPFIQAAYYNPTTIPDATSIDYIVYDTRDSDDFYVSSETKQQLLTDLQVRGLYTKVLDLDGILLLSRTSTSLPKHCFGTGWAEPACVLHSGSPRGN